MAQSTFAVNHPLAVTVWSKLLSAEAYRKTFIGKFVGSGEDSLIMEKVDLKKGAGDRINCGLNVQLQGDGIQGDATLEGNEEALLFYDDQLVINQIRHASRIKGKMTEQRVPYNLRETSKSRLSDWWARRMDQSFFNQVCGYTPQTNTLYTGNNAVLAPSTNRHVRQNGAATEQALASTDFFTLDLIDIARVKAETSSTEASTGPLVRPISEGGNDYYVMFLHDFQVHDLRTNTASGQWLDIQKAAMQGGDVKQNPIFTGALGIYNGVVLHKASRVTQGVNSSTGAAITTVRRAVLCGAQSAVMAFGSDNGVTKYSWHEEMFDYGNQFGVSAGSIFGIKKTRYVPEDNSTTNAEDFGAVVVASYAVAPTGA